MRMQADIKLVQQHRKDMKTSKIIVISWTLLVLFFLLPSMTFSEFYLKKREGHLIFWNERNTLNWSDFKEVSGKQRAYQAAALCGVNYSYKFNQNKLEIDCRSYFNAKRSWVKKSSGKSDHLLKHENLHFDIAELHARKLRKKLLSTSFKPKETRIKKKYYRAYNRLMKSLESYQDKYDKETNHSINIEAQKEWEEKIERELNDLEAYSDPFVIITFD